jgi:hypothetical protein
MKLLHRRREDRSINTCSAYQMWPSRDERAARAAKAFPQRGARINASVPIMSPGASAIRVGADSLCSI